MQNKEQKEDLRLTIGEQFKYKKMDYIAGWFYKGIDFIYTANAKLAFVTTNSIFQGEQVAFIWQPVLSKMEIEFAYTSFKWGNSAANNAGVTVAIDAYLNCPKYWFTSSCMGYKGSTSQVIKQVASTCGFGEDCDATQDTQLWMQGNMTYAEFVKYLTQKGFAGKGSYMMSGLTLSQSLVYKNVNNLPDSGVKVATFAESEGFFIATDFSVSSNSGLNNGGGGGYASLMRKQTTNANDTTYKTLDVKKKESNVNIDTNVVSEVQRSKVTFSYFNPEQAVNLWEGVYQNDRYSRLYTVNCNMIINSPTPLTLLTPYSLTAYNAEGAIDTKNSGTYIVDTRCMIIRGNKYGERISACRMGVN